MMKHQARQRHQMNKQLKRLARAAQRATRVLQNDRMLTIFLELVQEQYRLTRP